MHSRNISRAVALVTCLWASGASAASPTRKLFGTATQMLQLADQMVQRDRIGDAETILDAVAHDPDSNARNEARFRWAKLESGRGNLTKAAILLRQIIDETPSAAPVRLALAQVLDRMGDKDGAWRQLRAAQASGLPPEVARLIDRYSAALRANRRLGASLEIAVAPDSNINRATTSDRLGTVFGDFQIADEAKARSGTGLALTGQAFRRVAILSNVNLLFRASGFANLYRRSRFNDIAADFAVGPEVSFGRDRLQLELGATQRWFGQKPYLRSGRLAGTWSHPLGPRTLLRLTGSAALIDNRVNDLQDGKSYSAQVQVERALSPTTGIAGSLALDRQSLKEPGYSTTGWRAIVSGWHDLGRMTLTATAELGRLHADERLLLFPQRREDRYTRVSLGASFRQVEWAGFAPVLRFSIESNRSSIAFYDYRRTRTEIGIVRAF